MMRDQAIKAATRVVEDLWQGGPRKGNPEERFVVNVVAVIEALGLVKFEEPPVPARVLSGLVLGQGPHGWAIGPGPYGAELIISALDAAGFQIVRKPCAS